MYSDDIMVRGKVIEWEIGFKILFKTPKRGTWDLRDVSLTAMNIKKSNSDVIIGFQIIMD